MQKNLSAPSIFSAAYWREAVGNLKQPRVLVIAAMIVALRAICKMLEIPLGPGLNINVAALFNATGAMVYGPVVGLVGAIVSDPLGYLLHPDGPYFLPFMLVDMSSSFLYGLFFWKRPLTVGRTMGAKFTVNMMSNVVLTSLIMKWYYYIFFGVEKAEAYNLINLPRIGKNLVMFPIEAILIAVVLGAIDDRSISELRYRGYCDALRDAGITPDPDLVAQCGSFEMLDVYRATERLISRRQDVTAIFTSSDLMAMAAIKALHNSGLKVPENCSVISIDGIEMTRYIVPTLTSLVQPGAEMGIEAVNILLSVIEGTGPHRLNPPSRPDWFWSKEKSGGLLCDIGSHQADAFLFFTGETDADVVYSRTGNYAMMRCNWGADYADPQTWTDPFAITLNDDGTYSASINTIVVDASVLDDITLARGGVITVG